VAPAATPSPAKVRRENLPLSSMLIVDSLRRWRPNVPTPLRALGCRLARLVVPVLNGNGSAPGHRSNQRGVRDRAQVRRGRRDGRAQGPSRSRCPPVPRARRRRRCRIRSRAVVR
jgi:hypothetical protein